MNEEQYTPTNAEFLADLLIGDASISSVGATVQRSHRFPMSIFIQIENMARMGGVPVSLIINQLLECGLDAVFSRLPEAAIQEVKGVRPEQLNRATVTERIEAKSRKAAAKSKPNLTPVK